MQNNHFQKHQRGSSPPAEELQEGLNHWVQNLRSIKSSQDDSLAIQFVNQLVEQEKEVSDRKSDSKAPSADEQRWQDDGGESSEAPV